MQLDQIHHLLALQKQYENVKKKDISQEVTSQLNSLSLDLTMGAEIDCCKDQKGSRFIQDRLTSQTVDTNEKRRFMDVILKD